MIICRFETNKPYTEVMWKLQKFFFLYLIYLSKNKNENNNKNNKHMNIQFNPKIMYQFIKRDLCILIHFKT